MGFHLVRKVSLVLAVGQQSVRREQRLLLLRLLVRASYVQSVPTRWLHRGRACIEPGLQSQMLQRRLTHHSVCMNVEERRVINWLLVTITYLLDRCLVHRPLSKHAVKVTDRDRLFL